MDNYFERFESIEQFAATISGRQTNPVFAGRDESFEISDENTKWTGTKTFDEASNLLLNGDIDAFERLVKVQGNLPTIDGAEVSRRVHSVSGYGVNVSRYLQGSNKAMFSRKKTLDRGQVLNVVINITVSHKNGKESIEKMLCKMFSIINYIEKNDIQTNIYVYAASYYPIAQEVGFLLRIKEAGQPFNLMRYAYALTNPSMQRRHFFRFMETVPCKISKNFVGNYGIPRKIAKEDSLQCIDGSRFVFNLQPEIENGSSTENIMERVIKALQE